MFYYFYADIIRTGPTIFINQDYSKVKLHRAERRHKKNLIERALDEPQNRPIGGAHNQVRDMAEVGKNRHFFFPDKILGGDAPIQIIGGGGAVAPCPPPPPASRAYALGSRPEFSSRVLLAKDP